MPLLAGETLADRLGRVGRLALPDAVQVGRDVAAGLAAAHAVTLVHRDVKPNNIWLEALSEGSWRAVILDFGLARSSDGRDAVTPEGSVTGTPGYMSPEQARGDEVDGRADLFSLGCVLYEAVTGRRAFPGAQAVPVILAIADRNVVPPPPYEVEPTVPRELSDLIMRLLAKDRDMRFQSASAALAALEGRPSAGLKPASDLATSGPKERVGVRKSRSRLVTRIGINQRPVFACGAMVLVAIGICVWQPWRPDQKLLRGRELQGRPQEISPARGRLILRLQIRYG